MPGPAPCFSHSGTYAGLKVYVICNGVLLSQLYTLASTSRCACVSAWHYRCCWPPLDTDLMQVLIRGLGWTMWAQDRLG